MRNIKIITGNAYLADQKKQNFFSKEELNLILSVYGKGISSGKWKDYAIDSSIKETIFSIYKHASEMPIYRIIKNHKHTNKRKLRGIAITQICNISRRKLVQVFGILLYVMLRDEDQKHTKHQAW